MEALGEKIKRVLSKDEVEEAAKPGYVHQPNRAERRAENKTQTKYRQARVRADGKPDAWEWKPTQTPPQERRNRSHRRNKLAKQSRKANR